MDVQHALQARLDEVADPEADPEARRLMAQVALAKATSFIALLRADGRLLDVTDAPLTSGGLDRHEVVGPPAVADAVVPALRGRAGRPAAAPSSWPPTAASRASTSS